MPTWLIGLYRAGLQIAWTYVLTAAAARGWNLPSGAPAWLDEVLFGATFAAFVGAVQWLETRDESSILGRVTRWLASFLMTGARKADYPKPTPEAVKAVRGY